MPPHQTLLVSHLHRVAHSYTSSLGHLDTLVVNNVHHFSFSHHPIMPGTVHSEFQAGPYALV